MLRLGFKKFYTQGGDWGSAVVAHLSSLFPDRYILFNDDLLNNKYLTYVRVQRVQSMNMTLVFFFFQDSWNPFKHVHSYE